MKYITNIFIVISIFLLSSCMIFQPHPVEDGWEHPSLWQTQTDGKSEIQLSPHETASRNGLELGYELKKSPHGWVKIIKSLEYPIDDKNIPLVFDLKARSNQEMEIKLIDEDGSVFWKKFPLKDQYQEWSQLVVYPNSLEYGWGGKDDELNGTAVIEMAISGSPGKGYIWLDNIKLGTPDMAASFPPAGPVLDPDRELPGIGFKQRRDTKMRPKDPLVLEYLKVIQDTSSPDKWLLSSQEGKGNQCQTFNNALAAIAFILEDEKERAERILDFFAKATVKENWCPNLQNFYYKGEPRGFFQSVNMITKDGTPAYCAIVSDRWMGDMCWLLLAYKFYEKKYGPEKYAKITKLIKDLLVSWYKEDSDGIGGYLQHGWRKGDKYLHEKNGHPEGNIDAYAVLKLCGEEKIAADIKTWLNKVIKGKEQPLDLYTWRVLAFGKEAAELLNIPDYDLRFRKTLIFNGKTVSGFFHCADSAVNNIWLDGTGHIACAYLLYGDKQRGYFYANQLDNFLIDRKINGHLTRALPYTANKTGGYDWSEADCGFTSAAAWYIFAKNGFNPMTLELVEVEEEK